MIDCLRRGRPASHDLAVCVACRQARQEGNLDSRVSSLQARRALLRSIIPADYTYEASLAALQHAAQGNPAAAGQLASQPVGSHSNQPPAQKLHSSQHKKSEAPPTSNVMAANEPYQIIISDTDTDGDEGDSTRSAEPAGRKKRARPHKTPGQPFDRQPDLAQRASKPRETDRPRKVSRPPLSHQPASKALPSSDSKKCNR
jgi:hypothetical protein